MSDTVQQLNVPYGAYKKWNLAFTIPAGQSIAGRRVVFTARISPTAVIRKTSDAGGGITIVDATSATLEFQPADTELAPNASRTGIPWDMWLDEQPERIARGFLTIEAAVTTL